MALWHTCCTARWRVEPGGGENGAIDARDAGAVGCAPQRGQRTPRHRSRYAMDSAATHNLPEALTGFIGRASELEQIVRTLADARLLTLTGVGGAGKTRLAVEAGRRCAA